MTSGTNMEVAMQLLMLLHILFVQLYLPKNDCLIYTIVWVIQDLLDFIILSEVEIYLSLAKKQNWLVVLVKRVQK